MRIPFTFNRKTITLSPLCICYLLITFLISACNEDYISSEDENGLYRTGSYACSLRWPEDVPTLETPLLVSKAIDCSAAGVATVAFDFYDGSGSYLTGDEWSCSLHQGTVDGIPAGTNRHLVVTGKDSTGTVLYRGERTRIRIVSGLTIQGGEIAMSSVFPPAPTNVTATAGILEVTLRWSHISGATSYRLYWAPWSGVSKDNHDGSIENITTTMYTHTGLTNGTTYYYVVTAINEYGEGNESDEVNANPSVSLIGVVIELGDIGFDMELDSLRQQLYVSVPVRNEVVIISTQSYEIIDRVIVGSRPHGIDLSLDGTLLFAALNEGGAVAYLDMESMEVTEIVVGAELGDYHAYDVVEAKSNRVFVSANPGSSGFAYIAMIKREQGNSVVRVADNRLIRVNPIFEESPDHQYLYVGDGFYQNSLYKLQIISDGANIVLEDEHGSVSRTDHLEVNLDGSLIYLGSGQVLRTGSFIQAGLIGSGVPKLNNDGSLAYVGKEPNIIEIYDTTTFLKVDQLTTSCSFNEIQRIEILPNESGLFILGDDIVCFVSEFVS